MFDVASNRVEILGKAFALPKSNGVIDQLQAGRQVEVIVMGVLGHDGKLAKVSLRMAPADYVAGSSTVVITGRVSAANLGTNFLNIGKTTIDYSSFQPARIPRVGNRVIVVGTQPQRGGVILATAIGSR